jgi:hypothetical protein
MSASKNDIVKKLKNWLIHNSINDVTVKDLDEIGIDTSKSNQVIGNVEISNSFIWGPKIKVIDPKKDLECNLLSKNKDLLQKIKNTTYNGKYEINQDELREYGVFSIEDELIIDNVKLYDEPISNLISSFVSNVKTYKIELVDGDKNAGGQWKDDLINKKNVLKVLNSFKIEKNEFDELTEVQLNKKLEDHFRKYFENVKKGGRALKGEIDLLLGSKLDYGIELKLAKKLLSSSSCDRAVGQIENYTEEFDGGNFMLVIAGDSEYEYEKNIKRVQTKAKDCDCDYYYLKPI